MWRGTLDGDFGDGRLEGRDGAQMERANEFTFEPADAGARFRIPMGEVRAIYFRPDGEPGDHTSLRFFDAAPIPAFLWVRLTYVDGEVLEGIVKNHFSVFNDPLIPMSVPDPSGEQIPVFVPHCVVAELKVITTR